MYSALFFHSVFPRYSHTVCTCGTVNTFSHTFTGVQNGKQKGDISVGRYLADTCAAVPYIRKEDFEQLLQDNTQDALLVMYLSNLVKAHVALADKLGTAALPIL